MVRKVSKSRFKKTRGTKKIKIVMREFKRGTLKSGRTHRKVTNRKQAIAIALSEQRKKDKKSTTKKKR